MFETILIVITKNIMGLINHFRLLG